MTSAPTPASAVGSASVRVLGQVAGPHRSASVLHAGPHAVYLDVEGTCTCLLSAQATQVPFGIRTTLEVLPEVAPGDLASVEHGTVTVPGLNVLVAGIVDTTVPVLDPSAAARWSGPLRVLADASTRRVRDLLPADALEALRQADPGAVPALLGLGPGLTPLGDDVLGAWLATALATRHPGLDVVRRAVALSAGERTTTVSATLLACAARGEVVPEHRDLLVGLGADDRTAVEVALDALVSVGDTSGAGALLGTVLALESLPAGGTTP
ncbi:MAG: hypothetical protein AVDCRST_MAG24-1910 [uncultured Nocardioidaceae bacterium]|uniref:DUF2877 domain-containing protein n=1 Tax=uncultured Nocardioidaceae bacterium TaxID=253824 RepID=A0A6J4MAX0_9ACTN|nr:MAG: hypothetical protein AVDCRST_MAG24-1910 [uncultured Nocardioidaceae bacterium]